MHHGFGVWVKKNEKKKGSKGKHAFWGRGRNGTATRHLLREGNAYNYRLLSQEKRHRVSWELAKAASGWSEKGLDMENRFLEVKELGQVPLLAKETGKELLRESSGTHEIKETRGEQGCYMEGRVLCEGRVLRPSKGRGREM